MVDAAHDLAPLIFYDALEPFPAELVAIAVVPDSGRSPTSSMNVPPLRYPKTITIEYALWSDMEIGHAYELEHVWVQGVLEKRNGIEAWFPVRVFGSAHGGVRDFGLNITDDGRPFIYAEPGKHGSADKPNNFSCTQDLLNTLCTSAAGRQCLLHPPRKGQEIPADTHRRIWGHLRQEAFLPSYEFSKIVDVRQLPHISHNNLSHEIETRLEKVISMPSVDPLMLPVEEPNDSKNPKSTWIAEATFTEGKEWTAAGMLLKSFIELAAKENRMVILAVRNPQQLSEVEHQVWEAWGSSYTTLVAKEPGTPVKSCFTAYSIPMHVDPAKPSFYTYAKETMVREAHKNSSLLLGPQGDYHIDPGVLKKLGVL